MAPGCFATPSQELNESESIRPTGSENLDKNLIIFTGDEKINLEEIPLPAEPAPPLSQIVLLNHQLNKQQSETKVNLKKKNSPKIIYDTVDSFEVLEQTILKQKRLARLKNTDLRRKILLKRTFDLVCEIMDYENGFEADSDEERRASAEPHTASSSDSSSESDSDEESEKHDLLEEPSVKTNLTLVKLDSAQSHKANVYFDLGEMDEENRAQAEVPKKRRASHSDSDEDYSDDESEHYALKEQQLNSVNSSLDSLDTQLNLYSENRKKSYRKKRRCCDKIGAKSLSIALKA